MRFLLRENPCDVIRVEGYPVNPDYRSKLLAWLSILIASDAADICCKLYTGHRLPLGFELLRAGLLIPIALVARDPSRLRCDSNRLSGRQLGATNH
jgi:hypothetical protein